MLAFAVYHQRIALHFKIRMFMHLYSIVYYLIADLLYTSAFSTSYLYMAQLAGNDFVLRCSPAALPIDSMQYLRFEE